MKNYFVMVKRFSAYKFIAIIEDDEKIIKSEFGGTFNAARDNATKHITDLETGKEILKDYKIFIVNDPQGASEYARIKGLKKASKDQDNR